jgi:four helix bundle protein
MRDFRRLRVWQNAHELALKTYRLTQAFPKEEIYGLTSQMRRAAASIPANIAEGCGKTSSKEFARSLEIAAGSTSELDYYIILAKDLGYLKETDFESLSQQVSKLKQMLNSLSQKVRSNG